MTKLNIKIKELSLWERMYLLDIRMNNPGIFTMIADILRLGIESCDGAKYTVETFAGKKFKVIDDDTLEKIIEELDADEITEIVNKILEVNKIPFLKTQKTGGEG